jgi:hypothetical protein
VNVGYNPFDDRRTGEPSIAVNPRDPNNLIIAMTASTHTLHNPERTIAQYTTVPFNLLCAVGVSSDGGHNWKVLPLTIPVGPIPTTHTPMPRGSICFDATAAVGPDGTFHIAAVVSSPYDYGGARAGHSRDREMMGVFRAEDAGRSWTLLEGMGEGAGKPWLTVDQSTGILYLTNSGRNLVVTRDRGNTFDSPQKAPWLTDQPATLSSYHFMMSAALGQLAVVYVTDSPRPPYDPASSQRRSPMPGPCPCRVFFAASSDEGKNFVNHAVPMPDGLGLMQWSTSLPHVTVAADPTHRGRFAVAYANKDDTEMLVFVTTDSGASWAAPARLGQAGVPLNRIWISYSPDGVLGAFWRNNYASDTKFKPAMHMPTMHYSMFPPGTQDVFAAISRTGDANFTGAIKLNAARSPEDPQFGWGIDDYSSMAVDREAVHAAWGDYREIDRSVWYGQVPLVDFGGTAPKRPQTRTSTLSQAPHAAFEE